MRTKRNSKRFRKTKDKTKPNQIRKKKENVSLSRFYAWNFSSIFSPFCWYCCFLSLLLCTSFSFYYIAVFGFSSVYIMSYLKYLIWLMCTDVAILYVAHHSCCWMFAKVNNVRAMLLSRHLLHQKLFDEQLTNEVNIHIHKSSHPVNQFDSFLTIFNHFESINVYLSIRVKRYWRSATVKNKRIKQSCNWSKYKDQSNEMRKYNDLVHGLSYYRKGFCSFKNTLFMHCWCHSIVNMWNSEAYCDT